MREPSEPTIAAYRKSPLEDFAGFEAGYVGSKLRPRASAKALSAAERELGFALPQSVRALYRICNGVIILRTDRKLAPFFRVLPLDEVTGLYRQLSNAWPTPFQYFPFTDTNDSNPYAVFCNGPLKGRILHIRHDDYSYPAFRSLHSFLRSMWRLAYNCVDTDLLKEWHDFALRNPARTAEDDAAGMKLLHSATSLKLTTEWRNLFHQWAAALVAPERINELGQILDSGDEYRRSAAVERLTHIESPNAAGVLRRFENERQAFLRRCKNELAAAGLQVLKEEEEVFSIKKIGLVNLMFYFGDRRSPSVFADLSEALRRTRESNK
jgi:hypothetical protein